jgi:molecular chaperone DnaK
MTATLKNDPSERVSCTFSRGRSDEKIYKELEETIAELNDQNLTPLGVEEALKLALPVVQLSNEIIDPKTGEERSDLRDRASANLKKFQVSMSKERLEAESLANECDRVVKLCGSIIPQPQQERLQKLSQELQDAINTNNLSKMESKSEDARRELDNLPNEVHIIEASLLAIRQAHAVAPTQANAMSDKLSRMLVAMKSDEQQEANRLWSELQPDIQRWLNQELPSNSIVTGLTR